MLATEYFCQNQRDVRDQAILEVYAVWCIAAVSFSAIVDFLVSIFIFSDLLHCHCITYSPRPDTEVSLGYHLSPHLVCRWGQGFIYILGSCVQIVMKMDYAYYLPTKIHCNVCKSFLALFHLLSRISKDVRYSASYVALGSYPAC